MTATTAPTTTASPDRLRVLHVAYVHLIAALVVIQGLLAGQTAAFPGGSADMTTLHGVIGNAASVVALAGAGIALLRRQHRALVVLAVLVAVGVTAQIGLGYSGRETVDLKGLHVGLGVVVMALTAVQATLVTSRKD